LHRLDPSSGASRSWAFDVEVACCAPVLGGGLLLAMRDGLWRFEPVTGRRTLLAAAPYEQGVERFNDGKCDPHGRFWVGTLYEPRSRPAAALYCWDGRELIRRADGVTNSNGLAWSPDGRTMYWADTSAHAVYAFDVDAAGGLSRRRVFAQFTARDAVVPGLCYGGRPDGAAVDTEGCYWVAMYEGQRLLRIGPEGDVRGELRLPVTCPTMPCFGGHDLRTLFITTARHNRPPEELHRQPLAGCVLALPVPVPGLPVHFAVC
jgi:sugar lactone lactonase YvrE